MVRQRSRTGQGKAKRSVIRKDSSGSVSEQLPGREDGTDSIRSKPVVSASLLRRTVLIGLALADRARTRDAGVGWAWECVGPNRRSAFEGFYTSPLLSCVACR